MGYYAGMGTDEKKYTDIGERLKFIRERLDLSQVEIADMLNISEARWNNWEKGKARITIDYAIVLDHDHGFSLDFIYVGRLRMLDKTISKAWASRPRVIDSK